MTLSINKKNNFKIFLLIALSLCAGVAQALPVCTGGTISKLDWNTRDWPNPTNVNNNRGNYVSTFNHVENNIGGIDFTFAFSSDISDAVLTRSLENYADTNGAGLDTIDDSALIVGPGGGEEGLAVIVNPTNLSGTAVDLDVILNITLSEAVSALQVTLSDIDQSTTRQDQVTIVGSYLGNPVYPVLSVNPVVQPPMSSATFTIGGANNNVATAIVGAGNRDPNNNPADATLIVNFTQPIDSYQVVYADALESDPNLGGLRGMTMANEFDICPAYDVSGTVYDDTDVTGTFSAGDTPINAVTVQLFADDGSGNPTGAALATQMTDASGNYTFIDVAPGNYVIVETDPAGDVSVTDIDGTNDNQIQVTVTTANITGRDFLDIVSATDLSITKSDASGTYTPGGAFSYTITVTNNGPLAADGALVIDNVPDWGLGIGWSCSTTTTAVCPTVSTGNLQFTIDTFPSSSFLTFTITGNYSTNPDDYSGV